MGQRLDLTLLMRDLCVHQCLREKNSLVYVDLRQSLIAKILPERLQGDVARLVGAFVIEFPKPILMHVRGKINVRHYQVLPFIDPIALYLGYDRLETRQFSSMFYVVTGSNGPDDLPEVVDETDSDLTIRSDSTLVRNGAIDLTMTDEHIFVGEPYPADTLYDRECRNASRRFKSHLESPETPIIKYSFYHPSFKYKGICCTVYGFDDQIVL